MKRVVLLWLWSVALAAAGGPLALPAAPTATYAQKLDGQLPLATLFTDESGGPVPLGRFFDQRPVVLVLGYYQCPNLCSTLMDGVLQTLAAMDLPANAYRLVEVSIDPRESAELAARKKISFQPMLGRRGGDLHLLTGQSQAISTLAHAAGFSYAYDAALRQYVHPAGFIVATADGRIARYFSGVRFDAHDVRLALVEASSGRIGTPTDRLWLLCSHYDPASGRYSFAAMTLVRAACLLVLASLGTWIWLHRRRRAQKRVRP